MFRKTHFKAKNPLILLKLKDNIIYYYYFVINRLYVILTRYPPQVFSGMILLMLLSSALTFTVLRPGKKPMPERTFPVVKGAANGVLSAGAGLVRVLDLQQQIRAILSRDTLLTSDTLQLKIKLRELQGIQEQFNLKTKTHAD